MEDAHTINITIKCACQLKHKTFYVQKKNSYKRFIEACRRIQIRCHNNSFNSSWLKDFNCYRVRLWWKHFLLRLDTVGWPLIIIIIQMYQWCLSILLHWHGVFFFRLHVELTIAQNHNWLFKNKKKRQQKMLSDICTHNQNGSEIKFMNMFSVIKRNEQLKFVSVYV